MHKSINMNARIPMYAYEAYAKPMKKLQYS